MQLGIEHGVTASAFTVLGALISKLITNRQKQTEMQFDEAASIRKELREDVANLKNQIARLNRDLDHWKGLYFKLSEENLQMKQEMADLKSKLCHSCLHEESSIQVQ